MLKRLLVRIKAHRGVRKSINKKDMKALLHSNRKVILLDVRSPQEFAEGHLNGAINIPLYEIYANANKVIKDKEQIIIAYCSIGVRSKKATSILKQLGYNNVYNLETNEN